MLWKGRRPSGAGGELPAVTHVGDNSEFFAHLRGQVRRDDKVGKMSRLLLFQLRINRHTHRLTTAHSVKLFLLPSAPPATPTWTRWAARCESTITTHRRDGG